MFALRIITSGLLTLLPLAVLIRNWKFHDRRTRKHHRMTRSIVVVWFMASLGGTYFVWDDSSRIHALLDNIDDLLNTIHKYENRIHELESQAARFERGMTTTYYFNGAVRTTDRETIEMNNPLKGVADQMLDLEREKNDAALAVLCEDQIDENPDWPTPYLFFGIALGNLGETERAVAQLEHFLEIAPGDPQYGYQPYRQQASRFLTLLRSEQ